jgi:hypothetical protein
MSTARNYLSRAVVVSCLVAIGASALVAASAGALT